VSADFSWCVDFEGRNSLVVLVDNLALFGINSALLTDCGQCKIGSSTVFGLVQIKTVTSTVRSTYTKK
jgi:hypothetical protein